MSDSPDRGSQNRPQAGGISPPNRQQPAGAPRQQRPNHGVGPGGGGAGPHRPDVHKPGGAAAGGGQQAAFVKAVPDSPAAAGGVPGGPAQADPDHKGDGSAAAQQRTVDKLVGKLGSAASESDLVELDRARAEFHVSGSMTGNNIGRDNYTTTIYDYRSYAGQGASTIRAYRLTAEDLSEPFVGIDGELAAITAAAHDHRIVMVRGSGGIGKASALLHVFGELFPVGAPIMRLEPSTDLKAVSFDSLPENAVLVLPDLTAEGMRRLDDGFTFDHLGAELEKRNMRLGITGPTDVPAPAAARMSVVEMRGRPDPREVFDVHLAMLLMSRPSDREALLADPDVNGLLAELLDDGISMEEVARLAKRLSEQAANPAKAAAAVRVSSDRLSQEDCTRWFRGLPGLRANCMAIALAVLNGLSRELISSAADELEELIAPTPDPGALNATPKNPFLTGSDVSLSVLRAQTGVGSTSISTFGDLPITTLAFVHPKYPVWVVRLVWQEYDAARPALVTWLKRLGGHESYGVRVRTATAVGMLAIDAFTFLCQRVINDWALDDDVAVRDSAALAMAPPSANSDVRSAVTDLVDAWASSDSPLPQATAARVHGGEVGLAHPTTSLRKLAKLAEVENDDVAVAVARSLGDMVTNGTAALAGKVLNEMSRWTSTGGKQLRLAGNLAFLALSYRRGAPKIIAEETGDKQRGTPTLLVLAEWNPNLHPMLAELWSRCLNASDMYHFAGESLDAWATAVESDASSRARFIDVLRRSAYDPRTNRILVRAARRWSTGEGAAAPRTSHALLTP